MKTFVLAVWQKIKEKLRDHKVVQIFAVSGSIFINDDRFTRCKDHRAAEKLLEDSGFSLVGRGGDEFSEWKV